MTALVHISAFTRALAAVESVESGRELLEKVKAVERYAKAKRAGLEAQNEIATVRIRIERKLGVMVAETVQHGGDRKSSGHRDHLIRLTDIGVSQNESKRWQRETAVRP